MCAGEHAYASLCGDGRCACVCVCQNTNLEAASLRARHTVPPLAGAPLERSHLITLSEVQRKQWKRKQLMKEDGQRCREGNSGEERKKEREITRRWGRVVNSHLIMCSEVQKREKKHE